LSLWDSVYSSDNSYFGEEPSILAKESLRFFDEHHCKSILEFGCGQGRDTVFFARAGLNVHAVDFSGISVSQLSENILKLKPKGKVKVSQVDLSKNFPEIGKREGIDAVYSNLFYCMPFSDEELQRIFDFVYNTLPKGGLHIFSIRNKKRDPSFGKGKEVAKDTFEINGFRVRFFGNEEILNHSHGFKVLQIIEAYEEPCSLSLIFTVRL
jgi:cyclopropane fatty-acyl-phospholipid synthase-like methyltransferase